MTIFYFSKEVVYFLNIIVYLYKVKIKFRWITNRILRVRKMRELIFWILYGISAIAIVYRINKALLYFNGKLKKKNTEILLPELSIIQFIDNFGIGIESNIINNMKKLNKSTFIFVIEKEKIDIINKIEKIMKKEEYSNFVIIEVEGNLNYGRKLERALDEAKQFVIVLDENIEVEGNISEILEELSIKNFVVNGLLYGAKEGKALVGLSTAFYNNHKIFTDLSLAEVEKTQRVNRKFWSFRKETILDNQIFLELTENTVDEFELAKILKEKNVDIFQSRVVGKNSYEVKDFSDFTDNIGEEVEGFYSTVKDTISLSVHVLTIIPLILPSITLIYASFLGMSYVTLVITSLLLKAADTYVIRKLIVEKTLWYGEILREFIIDIFGIIIVFFRKSR